MKTNKQIIEMVTLPSRWRQKVLVIVIFIEEHLFDIKKKPGLNFVSDFECPISRTDHTTAEANSVPLHRDGEP